MSEIKNVNFLEPGQNSFREVDRKNILWDPDIDEQQSLLLTWRLSCFIMKHPIVQFAKNDCNLQQLYLVLRNLQYHNILIMRHSIRCVTIGIIRAQYIST